MGEDSLVDSLISKAERIVPRLPNRGVAVLAAFVAFEIEAEQWMLLVITSDGDSKLEVYDAIQSTARELDIYVNLGEVVHIRAGDPLVELLRAAAISQRYSKRYPPVEFGGRSFTDIHDVSPKPWQVFEAEILDSVRKIASRDWRISSLNPPELQPLVQVDFMIQSSDAAVAVEVKNYRRQATSEDVMTQLGRLRVLQQGYERIGILFVSSSGFTNSALAVAMPFRDIRLVSWEPTKSDRLSELRGAINELLYEA